jgi:hypothetical protein
MTTLILTPAYNRDYKTQAAVREAWATGKDFIIENPGYPTYINCQDPRPGITGLQFRYDQKRRVLYLKLS